MKNNEIDGYRWNNAALTCAHDYLLPALLAEMTRLQGGASGGGARV
jgi:hypothetical protein